MEVDSTVPEAPTEQKEKVLVESKDPNMKESDFSPLESKEEIEEKMKEILDSNILKMFEEAKWQVKKSGYEELSVWLFE